MVGRMKRRIAQLLLVLCSALVGFSGMRVLGLHPEPLVSKKALDASLLPARQIALKKQAASSGDTAPQKWAALIDDRELLRSINLAMAADPYGVAPEIMEKLSAADANLVQWLMLQFNDAARRNTNGPGAAARRTINEIVLATLDIGAEQP